MNIFVLDANPITAARFHNDRHVVKMILESCQLMATAHYVLDHDFDWEDNVQVRPTHINHPCAVWTRTNRATYSWVAELCGGLLAEYLARYGKAHGYVSVHGQLAGTLPRNLPKRAVLPTHLQCVPYKYMVPGDPVAAYRAYYIAEKQHLATWYQGDESKVPEWFKVRKDVA